MRLASSTSTLYADVPDDPGSGRHFRHSLEVLKRAVQCWNQCGARLAFVAHLGDALAAENAQADAQWSALHTFDEGARAVREQGLAPRAGRG